MTIKLIDFVGEKLEEDFLEFDLTEIQVVLDELQFTEAIDLAHAEMLQQQALRGADIVNGYLARIIKTVAYLETKINSTKNRVALEYKAPDGVRVTIEMRKFAAEASPEVEELQIRLARAKGSKSFLDKKYEILVSAHYHYKEIASGLRKTIVGLSDRTYHSDWGTNGGKVR